MTSSQVSISRFLRDGEGSNPLPSHQVIPYLDLVESDNERKWFNEIVRTHHSYVPNTNFCGRHIFWLIKDRNSRKVMGTIGVGSAVMAMKDRDSFIGWRKDTRLKNLTQIANNTRFCLIGNPPKNFGSQVLSLLCKLAPTEWKKKYGDPLYLLETLVEPPHQGTVYLASNWRFVGMTKGTEFQWIRKDEWLSNKGKMKSEGWGVCQKYCRYGNHLDEDRWQIVRESALKRKKIFVKPLHSKWKLKLLEVKV